MFNFPGGPPCTCTPEDSSYGDPRCPQHTKIIRVGRVRIRVFYKRQLLAGTTHPHLEIRSEDKVHLRHFQCVILAEYVDSIG